MTTSDEFLSLKSKVQKLDQQYHKASGALDTLIRQLKDFDCVTIEAALKKLHTLEDSKEELKEQVESKLAEFKEKWQDKLTESS